MTLLVNFSLTIYSLQIKINYQIDSHVVMITT